MMSDIEKENGWTVLSAIRAIPKQAENSEDDALMKILQGGKNNGAGLIRYSGVTLKARILKWLSG